MQLMQRIFANAGLPTDFYRMRERAADAWWQAELAVLRSVGMPTPQQ
jgi:hypothetical protein